MAPFPLTVFSGSIFHAGFDPCSLLICLMFWTLTNEGITVYSIQSLFNFAAQFSFPPSTTNRYCPFLIFLNFERMPASGGG